jgi:hypothetical protein
MGKTATNERIKLQATFLNNIAGYFVGVPIAAAVIPLFLKDSAAGLTDIWKFWWQGTWTEVDFWGGVVTAFIIAYLLHLQALRLLRKLQD